MASNNKTSQIEHKYSDEKQEVNKFYDNYTTENENENKKINNFNKNIGKSLSPVEINKLNFIGDENDKELLELFSAYIKNTSVESILEPTLDKNYAKDIGKNCFIGYKFY